jgi:hypothetical protein
MGLKNPDGRSSGTAIRIIETADVPAQERKELQKGVTH